MTLVLFLIILGALVFVHELGHFISAKKAGIRVDEFALGFPPKIFGKKVGETLYSLNLVPFGGYVRIFGEDGEAVADPSVSEEDKARSFVRRPRVVQAVVLASGVLGNIIFAWLLISVSFLSGIPSSLDGRYANDVEDSGLVVTSVLPNSPAAQVGLKTADKIVSLSSGEVRFAGTDAEAAREFIGTAQGNLSVLISRAGIEASAEIVPADGIIFGKKAIGVTLDTIGTVQFGFFRSFYEGFLMTLDLLREVAVGLFIFAGDVVRGDADFSAITGPVGIAGLIGEARVLGFVYLLSFTAFISINLAVINLLPLPALDGGRLLFLAIEAVIRRPIPVRIARFLNTLGFVLLIALMLIITYRDVVKMF